MEQMLNCFFLQRVGSHGAGHTIDPLNFSLKNLPFKNFPGDVSAQIILIKQPAQVAGLAAYQGWVTSIYTI